ncbi:hypothetical protein O181_088713 [Austropuccinia psidii MF-1]|uniref:Integrase catalytic domain-containing protein n=1 Tax=Austropuccinia psidii MF-1 TaxID=1389203 RepID=A0A9Q3IS33_9BASI|nr:hypothetical protein [Austropuccinia psidii MF-1]
MEISSTIAAAFFIRSLNQDKELTGLVQMLYNIKPFEFTSVMNRVEVEHPLQGLAQEQALAVDKQKQPDQPKPPTQGVHRDAAPHSSDSDAFVLEDEVLKRGSELQNQVYLDSGAGRSVVNNLSLPANIIKVNKQVNTYSDPVSITHQGTLSFRGIDISPVYYAPKRKIHADTLEISPPTWQGHRYILVLIDDYNLFIQIYLMTEKGLAEKLILSYFTKLKNKLGVTPGYLHTDQGGEFDSTIFQNALVSQGVSLKRGPPHSPQTNGVAERFNQTLLTKIRCLLAQSNILICYWNEASMHASFLLNHLPHKLLEMRSPNNILIEKKMTIQPVFSLTKIIPFGVKVLIKKEYPASKINPTGQAMKALTFEPYSDALRVLDTATGKIKVSRDYAQLKSETSVILRKNPSLLPTSKNQVNVSTIPLPTLTTSNSPIIQVSDSSTNKDNQMVNPTGLSESSRGYTYVPYYNKAPQDVSSSIST